MVDGKAGVACYSFRRSWESAHSFDVDPDDSKPLAMAAEAADTAAAVRALPVSATWASDAECLDRVFPAARALRTDGDSHWSGWAAKGPTAMAAET